LRLRKKNIALFGYPWIKPAGCPKTMMGMREEEAEREEGLAAEAAAAASADFGVVVGGAGGAGGVVGQGMDVMMGMDGGVPGQMMPMGGGIAGGMGDVGGAGDPTMERDLDDDIPEAEEPDDNEGLVEEGEEGFMGDDVNEELMERNLDDDIPEAYSSDRDDDDVFDDDNEDDGFDQQRDLDDDIPAAEAVVGGYMVRDLDNEVPEAAEDRSQQEGEWQHTDSEAEDDDDDDDDDDGDHNVNDPFAEHVQANLRTPQHTHSRPTEAQRRFLQRWSGTTDVLDSSGMMLDDDDDEEVRVSLASQGTRRISRFGRGFLRRGGPRDSLD
jgi:hypothetical protein